MASAEVLPGTYSNASEAGSGFSCELNSLPTKAWDAGKEQIRNLFKAKDPKKLKSKVNRK